MFHLALSIALGIVILYVAFLGFCVVIGTVTALVSEPKQEDYTAMVQAEDFPEHLWSVYSGPSKRGDAWIHVQPKVADAIRRQRKT